MENWLIRTVRAERTAGLEVLKERQRRSRGLKELQLSLAMSPKHPRWIKLLESTRWTSLCLAWQAEQAERKTLGWSITRLRKIAWMRPSRLVHLTLSCCLQSAFKSLCWNSNTPSWSLKTSWWRRPRTSRTPLSDPQLSSRVLQVRWKVWRKEGHMSTLVREICVLASLLVKGYVELACG